MNILPAFDWSPGITGIFEGIPNRDYHLPHSGLSRSIAEKIVFRSPAHAKQDLDEPKEATSAMTMGTLVHCGVLEPERLAASYYVRPDHRFAEKDCTAVKNGLAKPGDPIPWDGKAGSCKRWLAEHSDREVLSTEDEHNLLGCIKALKANPTVGGMLSVGKAELSVFVDYKGTILKCRPDLLACDKMGNIWDLDIKKCQDSSYWTFRRESMKAHRDFQEAWYRFVLSLVGIEVNQFLFVGVEELPPHGVGDYRIAAKTVTAAIPLVHQAIDEWKRCVETGDWKGYPPEIREMEWGNA
jgi:hypothetical protein